MIESMPYFLLTSKTGLNLAWLPCRFLGRVEIPGVKDAVLVAIEEPKKLDFVAPEGRLALTSMKTGFTLSPLNHILTPVDIHTVASLSTPENGPFSAAGICKVDSGMLCQGPPPRPWPGLEGLR